MDLAELFEAAPGYIAVLRGPEHRFQVANAAYRSLMRRDLIGETVAHVLPELGPQGHIELLDRVYETGEALRVDCQPVDIVGPDGTTEHRLISFVYQPIQAGGTVTGIFAEGLDVTPVLKAQEEARRAQLQLDAIFEQSAAGIAEVDLNGRFLRVNRRYSEIVGRSEDELRGMTMQDITHSNQLPENMPLFERVAGEGGSFEIEKQYVKPGGQAVWVHNSVTGLVNAEGEIGSVVCVSVDVTDRRAAQEQLRASEERYRRIFEQTSDLIITADLDQVITGSNPAAAVAVGLTPEEVIGRRIADFISPDDFGRTSSMLAHKLEQGGNTTYDVRVRHAAGHWLFWEINSGLATDAAGNPVGLHILARDVTERKQLEERQKLLFGELNHRVKNTLSVVQSIARQTLLKTGSPAEAQKLLESRLAALAAAQDAITEAQWGPVPLQEIVRRSLAAFCDGDRCHFEGEAVTVSPRVATSLSLAIHELATNASKYGALSNDTGHVALCWSATQERLRIDWREVGGPPVRKPTARGFGSIMIEQALARDLRATATVCFEPSGLVCVIEGPVQQPS